MVQLLLTGPNILRGGYRARRADPSPRRVLPGRGGGGLVDFSAIERAIGGPWVASSASRSGFTNPIGWQSGNGGFLPILAGRSGDVARCSVARTEQGVDQQFFFVVRLLIGHYATHGATHEAGGWVRRSAPRGRASTPCAARAPGHHPRRVRATGPSATFLLWKLKPQTRTFTAGNGVGGTTRKAAAKPSAGCGAGSGGGFGQAAGQGAMRLIASGGLAKLATMRAGCGHVN